MKLTIIFETKKLALALNSPIRVKELLHELSKKLKIPKNNKLSLFNQSINSCYEEQDFISNSDDLEIFLFTCKNLKRNAVIKSVEKVGQIEEMLKTCTNAKELLKMIKNKYKAYGSKVFKPQGQIENEFDYLKDIILNSAGSQNSSIRSKLSELMCKFESLKEGTIAQPQIATATQSADKDIKTEATATTASFNPFVKIANIKNELESVNKNPYKIDSKNPYLQPVQPEKIEANHEKLESLKCMGFEEDRCKKALIISKNNIEHATELLLGGSDFELYDQVNLSNPHQYNPYGNYGAYGTGATYGNRYNQVNLISNKNTLSSEPLSLSNTIKETSTATESKPSNYNNS